MSILGPHTVLGESGSVESCLSLFLLKFKITDYIRNLSGLNRNRIKLMLSQRLNDEVVQNYCPIFLTKFEFSHGYSEVNCCSFLGSVSILSNISD